MPTFRSWPASTDSSSGTRGTRRRHRTRRWRGSGKGRIRRTTAVATMCGALVAMLIAGGALVTEQTSAVTAIPAVVTYGLFTPNATPAVKTSTDPNPVEVGEAFSPKVNGWATGLRFYKGLGNSGPHVGTLWSPAGRPLAQVTFQTESAMGWQHAAFAFPVALVARQRYVISYHAPHGRYSYTADYFVRARDTALLSVPASGALGNGLYRYGSTSVFPTVTWRAANYFVDISFVTSLPRTAAPPPSSTTTVRATTTTTRPTTTTIGTTTTVASPTSVPPVTTTTTVSTPTTSVPPSDTTSVPPSATTTTAAPVTTPTTTPAAPATTAAPVTTPTTMPPAPTTTAAPITTTTRATTTTLAPTTTTTTVPAPAGVLYPAPGSVGAKGTLTDVSPAGGVMTIRTPTTLSNVIIHGGLDIYADTVLDNVFVQQDGTWWGNIVVRNGASLQAQDCTIAPVLSAANDAREQDAVLDVDASSITIQRCDISGAGKGGLIGDNTTIEDSWLHDFTPYQDPSTGAWTHKDAVMTMGGVNIKILRDRLAANNPSPYNATSNPTGFDPNTQTAAILLQPWTAITNVTIQNCYLEGGYFALRMQNSSPQGGAATGLTGLAVTGNVFGPPPSGGGYYTYEAGAQITAWSGNVTGDVNGKPTTTAIAHP